MSRTLPAPPPPLPTAIINKHALTSVRNTSKNSELNECIWALEYPELHKACYLARVCEQRPPRKCQLRNVPGMRQQGPTCGLTALSMLLGGFPTPEQLLQTARQRQYSNNGEMFSAQYLFQLICDNLPLPATMTTTTTTKKTAITLAKKCDSEYSNSSSSSYSDDNESGDYAWNVVCQMHEGRLDCAKIREVLLTGGCLLVPYDPDFNHAPCLKYGHKAHWALIIGYLITDKDEFYVLARHGKAKNLAVWSLSALSDSNANLIEFAQPKGYPDCDFLLPPGGIGGALGLRERAIIVNKLPQQIINIR